MRDQSRTHYRKTFSLQPNLSAPTQCRLSYSQWRAGKLVQTKLQIDFLDTNYTASRDSCVLQTYSHLTRQNKCWRLQTTLTDCSRTIQSHQTSSSLTGYWTFILTDQTSQSHSTYTGSRSFLVYVCLFHVSHLVISPFTVSNSDASCTVKLTFMIHGLWFVCV